MLNPTRIWKITLGGLDLFAYVKEPVQNHMPFGL